MKMLRATAIVLLYGFISSLAGWTGAKAALGYGLFGSCLEIDCGYRAIVFGLPLLSLTSFVLLLLANGLQGGSTLTGWRGYGAALIGFIALAPINFAVILILG